MEKNSKIKNKKKRIIPSSTDINCLDIFFTIKVTENNINMLKKVYGILDMPNINEEDDIEIGEELDLCYSLEGDVAPQTIPIAVLFNSNDVIGRPQIKLSRSINTTEEDKKFNKIIKSLMTE